MPNAPILVKQCTGMYFFSGDLQFSVKSCSIEGWEWCSHAGPSWGVLEANLFLEKESRERKEEECVKLHNGQLVLRALLVHRIRTTSHAFPDFLHKKRNFPSRLQHCIFHAELKMQVRLLSILLGAVLLLQSSRVHAHVRLTFPPARFPDYDFLDNVRTGGPCGIPGEWVAIADL